MQSAGKIIIPTRGRCNDAQRALDLFTASSLGSLFGNSDFVDPFAAPDDVAALNQQEPTAPGN